MNTNFLSKLFTSFIIIFSSILIFPQDSSAGVNPDGSFSYSVPIKVPEGTNGMQPNLSLEYNSNNKNGIVGYGWKLQGLPVITRNTQFPIEYEGEDNYVGPGGRLVEVDTDTVMGTDIFNYVEEKFIRLHRVKVDIGNGKFETMQWIAHHPDGTKYYYGSTSDSRIKAEGQDFYRYRSWALSKIEDVFGNSMTVEYYTGSDFNTYGAIYPKKIIYTQNAGISKYKAVEFSYEDRPDYWSDYSQQSNVEVRKRLKNIKVQTGITNILGLELFGNQVRRYELQYNYGNNKSTLTAVKEYNSNESDSKTIQFEWDNDNSITVTNRNALPSNLLDRSDSGLLFSGEFNGDGVTDLLLYDGFSGENTWFFLGEENNYNLTDIINPSLLTGGWKTFHIGDFNGDHLSDLFLYDDGGGSNKIFLNKGGLYSGAKPFDNNYISIKISDTDVKNTDLVRLGDWNGDGTTDFLFFDVETGDNTWVLSEGGTSDSFLIQKSKIDLSYLIGFSSNNYEIKPGDFNGDGKADICVLDHSNNLDYWYISKSSRDSVIFKEPVSGKIHQSVFDKLYYVPQNDPFFLANTYGSFGGGFTAPYTNTDEYFLLDINNDGLTDFMPFEQYCGLHLMYLNTGNANLILTPDKDVTRDSIWVYGSFDGNANEPTRTLRFRDFNGDGKVDAFNMRLFHRNSRIILNKNGTFDYHNPINIDRQNSYSYHSNIYTGSYKHAGNWNSTYLMYSGGASGHDPVPNGESEFKVITAGNPTRIKEITTYTGGKINISYKTDHTASTYYTNKTDYPYVQDKSPRYLIDSVITSDEKGYETTTKYKHEKGKLYMGQPHERKNLIFEKVTAENLNTGIKKTTYFKQDNHYFAGKPERIEVYDVNNTIIQATDYTYYGEDKLDSDTSEIDTIFTYSDSLANESNLKTRLIRTKSTKSTTYEKGNPVFSNTKTFVYNDHGAVRLTTDEATGTDTIETTIEHHPQPSQPEDEWILNRPSDIQKKIPGAPTPLRHQKLYYTGAILDSVKEYQDVEDRWISKSFLYDTYGNLHTVTDNLNNKTEFLYEDEYHATPTKVIDVNGNETILSIDETYNSEFSKIVTSRDDNGNVTEYRYDHFERLIEVALPGDEWTKKIDYHDEVSGNPSAQFVEVMTKDESELGYHYLRSYFDGLGRIYKTESKADHLGKVLIKETQYNSKGQVESVSNPYLDPCDSVYYSNYEYDARGRISKVIAPNGNGVIFDTYSYSSTGNRLAVTTTNANGKSFYSEIDSRGQLRKK